MAKKNVQKFGAIGVFGRANAGKSTMINGLVGEEVSIVSDRPQTTRRRILGILTKGLAQMVFCDTPGLHPVRNKLDAFMDDQIHSTLGGLQAGLYLVDVSAPKIEEDQGYLEQIAPGVGGPLYLVLNKIDLIEEDELEKIEEEFLKLADFKGVFKICASKKMGLRKIYNRLEKLIPEGPHAYDADFYTSMSEREICEEVVRQVALESFYHEVPHSVAVMVEQFKERESGKTFVEANIYVERESHKKIIIGKKGEGIRTLGRISRQRLNRLLGRDIFLQLWIKVKPNWRKKEEWVQRLGYKKQ